MCGPLLLFGFFCLFSGWQGDAFAFQGFAYQLVEGFCPVEVIQYLLDLLALLCPLPVFKGKGMHDVVAQSGLYLV